VWLILSLCSAIFAGFVSVLGKRGMASVPSNLATAIRSAVALLLAWVLVLVSGVGSELVSLSAGALIAIALSGLATGASWLMYFKALKLGRVAQVVAIDRTSLLFTGLFAIAFFGEANNLSFKLVGLVLVFVGTLILVWQRGGFLSESLAWLPWAIGSMAFAVATTLLAKAALDSVDSTLATALRTVVVVVFAAGIAWSRGEFKGRASLGRRDYVFLGLSGLATGASWLCYFGALKLGQVSLVAPIDKLSIVFAAVLAYFVLGEKVSKRGLIGLAVMVAGTLVLVI
jgi:transporter family protein